MANTCDKTQYHKYGHKTSTIPTVQTDKNHTAFLTESQARILQWGEWHFYSPTYWQRNKIWKSLKNAVMGRVGKWRTWPAQSIAFIWAVTAAAATAAAVGIGVVAAGIIWGKFGGVHACQHTNNKKLSYRKQIVHRQYTQSNNSTNQEGKTTEAGSINFRVE